MSAREPPACRCGRAMRPALERDALECRCGMSLDYEAYIAAGDGPIPEAAFEQGEPWKEREPGVRISDKFSDISEPCWETTEVDAAKCADKDALQRACADAFECSGLRYIRPVKPGEAGRALILDDGTELPRRSVYALVPVGREAEAVRGIVRFILDKHGPGRLWTHGGVPIGPLKRRDQAGYRGAEIGGVLHVVLGSYYFHRQETPS